MKNNCRVDMKNPVPLLPIWTIRIQRPLLLRKQLRRTTKPTVTLTSQKIKSAPFFRGFIHVVQTLVNNMRQGSLRYKNIKGKACPRSPSYFYPFLFFFFSFFSFFVRAGFFLSCFLLSCPLLMVSSLVVCRKDVSI